MSSSPKNKRLRSLADFNRDSIAEVGLHRFIGRLSLAETACIIGKGMTGERVRVIENAIIATVEIGDTDMLTPAVIARVENIILASQSGEG